jgi:long-chain acyl-CoA synthetase
MKKVESEPPVPIAKVSSDHHLVLIYTSGTTGNPKGVILTHDNAMSVLRGLHALKGSLDDHVTLAFLPWAHVFGQNTELHAMVSSGSACGIVSNRFVSRIQLTVR